MKSCDQEPPKKTRARLVQIQFAFDDAPASIEMRIESDSMRRVHYPAWI